MALWSEACAVIRITGVIGSCSRAALRISRPDTCGMRTSERMMSWVPERICSSPAFPP
jgi:hypothetical protein